MRKLVLSIVFLGLSSQIPFCSAQTREEKVRQDLARFQLLDGWLYNDVDRGFADAARTGKPLMVVLRCVPCEECVKLDDELIEQHPSIQPLLNRFVRVRQVATNGLDLRNFQFDYDQSFAIMFFNGDGTVYGRYGTRSHRTEWKDDVSVEGLARAMSAVLDLHQDLEQHRSSLLLKSGTPPIVERPELFPSYQGRFLSKLDYAGRVDRSCIHCHQVGDAIRDHYLHKEGKLPEDVLFPYPHPKVLGLILDPAQSATVRDVVSNSIADKAGIRIGDRIVAFDGQPPVSIADIQFALHRTGSDRRSIPIAIVRDNASLTLELELPTHWKASDDISWRATTWELRRVALGGMQLEELSPDQKTAHRLSADKMALMVKHCGKFAPHNDADQAGVRAGDLLVGFQGRTDLLRETDLIKYALDSISSGESIRVSLLRQGKPVAVSWKKP